MGNIVIQGIESLLGSYFAARYLQEPANRVFYLADANYPAASNEIADRMIYAAQKLCGEADAGCVEDHVQKIENVDGSAEIAALWCFVNPVLTPNQREIFTDALLACDRLHVRELN